MEIKNPFGLFELDRMPRNSMDKIKYPIQLDPTIEKRKTLGNSMKLNFPFLLLLLLLLLLLWFPLSPLDFGLEYTVSRNHQQYKKRQQRSQKKN